MQNAVHEHRTSTDTRWKLSPTPLPLFKVSKNIPLVQNHQSLPNREWFLNVCICLHVSLPTFSPLLSPLQAFHFPPPHPFYSLIYFCQLGFFFWVCFVFLLTPFVFVKMLAARKLDEETDADFFFHGTIPHLFQRGAVWIGLSGSNCCWTYMLP